MGAGASGQLLLLLLLVYLLGKVKEKKPHVSFYSGEGLYMNRTGAAGVGSSLLLQSGQQKAFIWLFPSSPDTVV